VSGRTPGDDEPVQATLDDLPSVQTTNPILKPVGATITLDEEPLPAPSATQLLDPVEEVPTDPKVRVVAAPAQAPVQRIGESVDAPAQLKKRKPLKADAFESAPSLQPARRDEVLLRGAPPSWQKSTVWTPGLIILAAVFVAMLIVGFAILLH
jgi:hypothetical protein